MKFPIVTESWIGALRMTEMVYMTRKCVMIMDTDKCITCKQCMKVCPQGVLVQQEFPRKKRTTKMERIPYMENPRDCVFCGICEYFCPYDAIKLKIDGEKLDREDLPLFKKKILPKLSEIKVMKAIPEDSNFHNRLWDCLIDKITINRNR